MESRLDLADLAVGYVMTGSRTFTPDDVAAFCLVTRDKNPLHSDEEFSRKTRFGRTIVPGLLVASLFADVASYYDVLAQEVTFSFRAPVYVGETVEAAIRITDRQSAVYIADFECRTAEGRLVIEGTLRGISLSAIINSGK
jgi:3-hydroxybutyryl-CoA dehydratase